MNLFQRLVLPFLLTAQGPAYGQPELQLIAVADGLGQITAMANAGDDRLFVTTQQGMIRVVQNGAVLPTPFLDHTSTVHSQWYEQGLLGIAFDPDFSTNGYFYLHYIAQSIYGTTRVSRFQVSSTDPNIADPATEHIIYTLPQWGTPHNGGDIQFGPDGYLYISLGDGGQAANGQDKMNAFGTILRIDVSGSEGYTIPPDNPFADGVAGAPEIWLYGLRNPWRIGFDALTGDLWIGDVGAFSWEEINFWPAGDNSGPNFGWNCMEGFATNSIPGCAPFSQYVEPIMVQPTSGSWCSIIGGRVYRGSLHPELYGRYIYTDFCNGEIHSILSDGNGSWQNELLNATGISGFTVIAEDHLGELYFGNRTNGTLYRLVDELTVGSSEATLPSQFRAYPIPASEHLTIHGPEGEFVYRLYDHEGRLVTLVHDRSGKPVIDILDLTTGMYSLVISDGSGSLVHWQKVVVMER